jgi:hypothetical protein
LDEKKFVHKSYPRLHPDPWMLSSGTHNSFVMMIPCSPIAFTPPPFKGRRKTEMSESPLPITPHRNDILMGRGGTSTGTFFSTKRLYLNGSHTIPITGKNNQHTGNDQLRALAREQCQKYRLSSKKGKSYISRELVRAVLEMTPPGRFLKKNADGVWEDMGEEVAREKASQALRDAVSLTSPTADRRGSTGDADERRMTTGDSRMAYPPHVPSMSSAEQFRRSSSAPPIMDKSPEERVERKTWAAAPQETHHPFQEHPSYVSWQEQSYQQTPHYPPVTPRSATTKMRRYPQKESPWMFRPENPPYASPAYVRSAPDLAPRSYPTQSARSHESPGLLGEVDGDMHEFDLFDGELLDESMEKRSETF